MPEGHTIHRLAGRHERLLVGATVAASSPQGRFEAGAARLDGQVLRTTDAWGKHLFHEYDEALLHVHLGLFGRFRDGRAPAPPPRGAVRLRLETDERWFDLRGPIRCALVTEEERDAVVARLGPDPLRADAEPARFVDRVLRSRVPVGRLLMDQAVIAGVGNVYRAEVLFRQRLSPFTPGRDLDATPLESLWADLVGLMPAGVATGRIVTTSPDDRARPHGRARREDAHYVYRRAGRPCRRCGTTVLVDDLAGRRVYWCPICQL